MIITESKPFGMIKDKLKKTDKISLNACNECAKLCGTGGEEGLKNMETKLKEAGFEVVNKLLFAPLCDKDLDKKVMKNLKGNTILVLACDAGFYNIKKLFKNKSL